MNKNFMGWGGWRNSAVARLQSCQELKVGSFICDTLNIPVTKAVEKIFCSSRAIFLKWIRLACSSALISLSSNLQRSAGLSWSFSAPPSLGRGRAAPKNRFTILHFRAKLLIDSLPITNLDFVPFPSSIRLGDFANMFDRLCLQYPPKYKQETYSWGNLFCCTKEKKLHKVLPKTAFTMKKLTNVIIW